MASFKSMIEAKVMQHSQLSLGTNDEEDEVLEEDEEEDVEEHSSGYEARQAARDAIINGTGSCGC